MSMLAGPRRKQKVINLRAKNNAWSNDNSKFGQRMLEKMGWSSGKGLGAKENGIVEHVVARYKNDEKGLGFEDKNDQWTKHEDDFNSLLASLSNAEPKEEISHSAISLEKKSKKSKARIHYHKFTRGKDLSRYSEKDLANIFGKKSFKAEEKIEEAVDDIQTTEQVFTEKGSMEDYFKSKLAFKFKNKIAPVTINNDYEENDYVFQGFSSVNNENEESESNNQGFGFKSFSFYDKPSVNEVPDITDNINANTESIISENTSKKKKKKKSKENNLVSETDHLEINNEICEQPDEMTQSVCKKKKKSKRKQDIETNITEEVDIPKKKKKRKNKELPLE